MQTEQEEEMGETKGGFSFEENKSYKKIVEIDRSKTDYLQLFIYDVNRVSTSKIQKVSETFGSDIF